MPQNFVGCADELLPAIRDQLDVMSETVDSLLKLGPR
jgi:hypothetical protein